MFTDGGQSALCQKNGEDPIRDETGNAIGYRGSFTQAQVDEDLKWAVAYAKRRVPGVTIYAVGKIYGRLGNSFFQVLELSSVLNSKSLLKEITLEFSLPLLGPISWAS